MSSGLCAYRGVSGRGLKADWTLKKERGGDGREMERPLAHPGIQVSWLPKADF